MTYIDYMKQLWRVTEITPLSSSDVALYTLLVNECNVRYWKMPFPCTSIRICEILRMSKQTLTTSRRHLAEVGLITFTNGSSRFAPSKYCLLELTDDLTAGLTEDLTPIKTIDKDRTFPKSAHEEWDGTKNFLRNDESWLHGIVDYMNGKGYAVRNQEVQKFLDIFFHYLELSSDTRKSIDEIRKHFLNWLVKQQQPSKPNGKKAPRGLVLTNNSSDKYKAMKERMGL